MVMRLRGRQIAPPPSQTRFDSWSTEDIYAALEAQLMDLLPAMDSYRQSSKPDDKGKALGVMAIKMDSAREALDALRRRLAVANGKRPG